MNLRKVLFILPNLFTLSSIFCGFYAAVLCLGGNDGSQPTGDDFNRAALLIMFAGFFDSMDGRVARLTKTQSAFGVQIDSLADLSSFGVAPALLVYRWSLSSLGSLGLAVSFSFLACAAIRLARFNVLAMTETGAPKTPSGFFSGLPTPGAAGVVVSLVLADHALAGRLPGPSSPVLVLAVIAGLSLLMVSSIPFRTFKNVKSGPRTFALIALMLGSAAAVGVIFHPSFALVWLLGCYVVMAFVEGSLGLSRRVGRRNARSLARDTDDSE
jgi:CDP-diacylglycerol--serine O-phosphatidyltransferase